LSTFSKPHHSARPDSSTKPVVRHGRYPTSQQDGIGALSSASKTTIKTNAKQSSSAAHRPDTRFGAILLGSHGNIFVV
ncbi:MAG: hypothetical protein WAM44_15485, partial [Chthoniobacterales bacterium]